MKSKTIIECVLVFALATFPACNRGRTVEAAREDGPTITRADQSFMMKAAQSDSAQMGMSRMALEKSANSDVKDFAHMIEMDHKAALENLKDLMSKSDVQVLKGLPSELQHDIDRMSSLTGSEFDREFINMMVSDHQKAIEMFNDEESSTQDPDMKMYVENTLPILEMHLDKARQLQAKLFSKPNRPENRTERPPIS
jgi:putative membrane protein